MKRAYLKRENVQIIVSGKDVTNTVDALIVKTSNTRYDLVGQLRPASEKAS